MITCPRDEGQIKEREDGLRLGAGVGWGELEKESHEDFMRVKAFSKLVCGR